MVPYIGEAVADKYAGEEPSMSDIIGGGMFPRGDEMTEAERQEMQERMTEYKREYQEYWDRRTNIERIFTIFSPNESYEIVSDEITGTSHTEFRFRNLPGESEEKSLTESLGSVLPEIFSLLMIPMVMLIATYLKFMRMDIR